MKGYEKYYTRRGFWDKLRQTARKAGKGVVYQALVLYYVLVDRHTPVRCKTLILGALGYFILPVDLVPDLVPMGGFADDLVALLGVMKAVQDCVTPSIEAEAERRCADWFPKETEAL